MAKTYKVKTVVLHGALTMAGFSGGDKTLYAGKNGAFKEAELTWTPDEQAVRIRVKGRVAVIPIGAINSFEIMEEEPVEKKAK